MMIVVFEVIVQSNLSFGASEARRLAVNLTALATLFCSVSYTYSTAGRSSCQFVKS